MIAAPLDSRLAKLARRFKCNYTRYVDDITFSRNGRFPTALAQWDGEQLPERVTVVGSALENAITSNGFQVNEQKVHLRHSDERQIVTGLVVNEMVNVPRNFVRRIRAMLHAWEVYGLAAAEREYREKYDTKDRPHGEPAFKKVVKGHIDFLGMVRGKDHRWYQEFIRQYAALDGDYQIRPPSMYRPNHLRTWRDAIWVVETEEMQGTAFQLEGVGFVTCAHVLASEDSDAPLKSMIYHPRNPAVSFPAHVVRFDVENDVAILASDAVSGVSLKRRALLISEAVGARVNAAGYPRHAKGASLWEEVGVVTLTRHFEGRLRYVVNMAIVAGASGSPVMDMKHCVVGMATTGVAGFRTAASKVRGEEDYPDYGVIPVDTIVGLK